MKICDQYRARGTTQRHKIEDIVDEEEWKTVLEQDRYK